MGHMRISSISSNLLIYKFKLQAERPIIIV